MTRLLYSKQRKWMVADSRKSKLSTTALVQLIFLQAKEKNGIAGFLRNYANFSKDKNPLLAPSNGRPL
jgi:hypothetical protein